MEEVGIEDTRERARMRSIKAGDMDTDGAGLSSSSDEPSRSVTTIPAHNPKSGNHDGKGKRGKRNVRSGSGSYQVEYFILTSGVGGEGRGVVNMSSGSTMSVGRIMGISSRGIPSAEMLGVDGPPRIRALGPPGEGELSVGDNVRLERVRSSWLKRRRFARWEVEDALESSLLSDPLGVEDCLRFVDGMANQG